MGMFDNLRCKYPLPVPGANERTFQTKSTPARMLDLYEIREDGTLWHLDYDIEDRSEASKWLEQNPGQELPEHLRGLGALAGMMTRVNQRWEQLIGFIGEIRFYEYLDPGWIEFSSYFEQGKVARLNLIKNEQPKAKQTE